MVIIGGGFGGLGAAEELKHDDVDITIVDRNNFHTFQPLLYQVATAGLNDADVAYPIRGIFQRQDNVAFRRATVEAVDWDTGELTLDDGILPFDQLIVAAGASTNTFGVPGAEEHSYPLYNLRDAVHLRNHVLRCFEEADTHPELVAEGAITVVVVGGGPTGVEVAGAMAELFDRVLRKDFNTLDVGRARVILIEMQAELLGPFSPTSQRHAREILRQRGVQVRTDTSVDKITATEVHLKGGEIIPTHTLIWAAGVKANALAATLGVETGPGGRIVVGSDLRIAGHPDAYAIGDIAQIPGKYKWRVGGRGRKEGARPLPQLAQVAIQSGHHAARQIRRAQEGKAPKPFRYFDKGTMATIGRRAAVAELPGGLKLQGTIAWFAWLGLHLIYLVGFRNRVSVFLNWWWNYLTWDRGPRLITDSDSDDVPGPTAEHP